MKALNNMKIGTKLMGGYITLAVLLLVVASIGFLNMKNINDGVTSMYYNNLLPDQQLASANSAILMVRGNTLKALYLKETTDMDKEMEVLYNNIDLSIAEFQKSDISEADNQALNEFEAGWEAYKKNTKQITSYAMAGDWDSAQKIVADPQSAEVREQAETALATLIEYNKKEGDENNTATDLLFYQSTWIICIVGGIALILAITIGIILTNSITKPLNKGVNMVREMSGGQLSQSLKIDRDDEIGIMTRSLDEMLVYFKDMARAAEQISEGDLTTEVSPRSKNDVLGNAFAKMANNLNSTLQQTNLITNQVVQSIEQVRSVSQDLASNSQEQSSAVEEVASSVEETDSQVKASADHANVANQLASQTTNLANVGQDKMKALSQSMNSIATSSMEISKIIKVIDDIAFQTNLLALNAAVEAARAGQYGKGFAVVAQEVRNLAERSAKAAKSTAELIEDSSRRVQEGVNMTDETATSLNEIVQNVVKVKDLVGEIAAASDEQTKALNQISQAITQVSQGTQSNSTQSEELASTADELGSLADRLREEVNRFKLRKTQNNLPASLPSGITPEMLQAVMATLQKNSGLSGGKLDGNQANGNGINNINLDERGYENF